MTEAVRYPLSNTINGDLATDVEIVPIAITRGRLLVDVRLGERVFYPQYGSEIYPFAPSTFTPQLEAEILQTNLNRWCITDVDTYQYFVSIIDDDKLNLHIEILLPES